MFGRLYQRKIAFALNLTKLLKPYLVGLILVNELVTFYIFLKWLSKPNIFPVNFALKAIVSL